MIILLKYVHMNSLTMRCYVKWLAFLKAVVTVMLYSLCRKLIFPRMYPLGLNPLRPQSSTHALAGYSPTQRNRAEGAPNVIFAPHFWVLLTLRQHRPDCLGFWVLLTTLLASVNACTIEQRLPFVWCMARGPFGKSDKHNRTRGI